MYVTIMKMSLKYLIINNNKNKNKKNSNNSNNSSNNRDYVKKKLGKGQTNMNSTNKKLTLDAQNFGYLNILIKIVKFQKDRRWSKTLNILTYKTLGITKMAIRPPI